MGIEELLEAFDKDVFEHLVAEEQALKEGKHVDTSWQKVPRTFQVQCMYDHDHDGDVEENMTTPYECTVPRTTLDIMKQEIAEMFNVELDVWKINQREFRDGEQTAQRKETIVTTEYKMTKNKLFYHPPYYDDRIKHFCPKRYLIDEQVEWRIITADQPWTEERQREKCGEKLRHLLTGTEPSGILDAAHGFWELSVRKEHHHEMCFEDRVLHSIVYGCRCGHPEVMARCIACVWNLITTKDLRRRLISAGIVEALYDAANLALVECVPLEDAIKGIAKYRWCSPDASKTMLATEGQEEKDEATLEAEADELDDEVMTMKKEEEVEEEEEEDEDEDEEGGGDEGGGGDDEGGAGGEEGTGDGEDGGEGETKRRKKKKKAAEIPQDVPGPETRLRANGKKNLMKSKDGSHYIGFVKDPSLMDDAIALSHMTQPLRDRLQLLIQGTLGVLLVDKVARHHVLHIDPAQEALLKYLDFRYFPNDTHQELVIRARRASENLLAYLKRDKIARREFALSSGIDKIAMGLKGCVSMMKHPDTHCRFIASQILALYAKDPKGAQYLMASGVAKELFEEAVRQLEMCIILVDQQQKKLPKILMNMELAEQMERDGETLDYALVPQMTESLSISIWGATDGYILSLEGIGLPDEFAVKIPRLAACLMRLKNVGKSAYALSGAMTVCARDMSTASTLLKRSNYTNFLKGIGTRGCIKAMLTTSTTLKDRTKFLTHPDDQWYLEADPTDEVTASGQGRSSGRVRAQAAGILGNFLAHNRECGINLEDGPFRELMSEIRLRLLPALHLSTLSPATLEKAFKQLHRASACCYMYVATLFPRVWPSSEITCLLEFSEYSSAPGLFDQPLVTQFLWAAFWLIMRNEENRTYLVNLLLDEIEKNGGGGEDGEKKDGQNDSGDAEESNAEELQPDPSQENEAIPEGAAAAIEDMEGNHQRFMDVTLRVMENFFPCLAELVPPAWTDDKKQSPSLYLYSFCFGAIWLFSYNDDDQRQLHEDVYRQNELGWWSVPKVSFKPFQDEEFLNRLLKIAMQTLCLPYDVHREGIQSIVIGCIWNLTEFDVGIRDYLLDFDADQADGVDEHGIVDALCNIVTNFDIQLVELRRRAMAFLQYIVHKTEDTASEVTKADLDKLHSALQTMYEDNGAAAYEFVYKAVKGLVRFTNISKETNVACMVDVDRTLKLINDADKRFRRRASPVEILELRHMCLLLLLNLSTVPDNQVMLAKKGLYLLLAVNRSRRSPRELRQVSSCILHNISKHAGNRTRFYKVELSYKKKAIEQSSDKLDPRRAMMSMSFMGAGGWDGKKPGMRAETRMWGVYKGAVEYLAPGASLEFPPHHHLQDRGSIEFLESRGGAVSPFGVYPGGTESSESMAAAVAAANAELGIMDEAAEGEDDTEFANELANGQFADMDPFQPTDKFMEWADSTFGVDEAVESGKTTSRPSTTSRRRGAALDTARSSLKSSRDQRALASSRLGTARGSARSALGSPLKGAARARTPARSVIGEMPSTRGGRLSSRMGDVSQRASSRMSMASHRGSLSTARSFLDQLRDVEDEEEADEETHKEFHVYSELMRAPLRKCWVPLPRLPGTGPLEGKERWNPRVRRYVQQEDTAKYPGMGEKLMMAKRPGEVAKKLHEESILVAKEVAHDRLPSVGGGCPRPSTAMVNPPLQYCQEMPLTLIMGADKDDPETPEPQQASQSAAAREIADFERSRRHQLSVHLETDNPKNVVDFRGRVFDANHPARLTVFEAVPGARVYEGLFPKYQLPNGHTAHYYDRGNKYVDGVNFGDERPPPRPVSLEDLHLDMLPYADVLEELCKMDNDFFGDTYTPKPSLGPLPRRHTLDVKDDPQFFGDLRITTMKLEMETTEHFKYEEETKVETFGPRPDWDIRKSIFAPRERECDSRDFWDTPKTEARMLDLDMRRMLDSSRTKGFLKREGEKVGKDVETVVAELNDIFKQVWDDLYGAFMWYSLQGSGDPYCMQLNAFSQFTDDCKIPDSESEKCKRSDLDTLFIVANFEEDKNSALSKFNDDNSLMRFEFMDILIRMGIAKYGNGALTEDPVEAFRELLDRNVFLHLGSEAIVKANDFRSNRLYNEETDHYLRTRKQLLQAMYSRYRLRPAAGGLRPKVLRIEGWLQMIEQTNLLSINIAFTINQAKYCFMFARMIVIDELKDEKRWRSLTFVDFLDALGRVADNFSFPFKDDLRRLGWNNIYEYMEYAAYTAEEDVAGKIFPSRTSAGFSAPKTRPLKGKVEALLDLMFMRLAFNADDPNYEYSDAYLLKLLRKQDKDLGP
ncbi:flagellar associated protein [Pseudoscourfieldia marina]